MKNIFFEQFFEDNLKTTEKFEILKTLIRCKILRPTILYLGKIFENWTENGYKSILTIFQSRLIRL